MPESAVQLSMLEAVQLFNGKPTGEWTEDELSAFRTRLELSPGLIGAVGGQQAVERRLAEVETAIKAAKERPAPVAVVPDKAATSIRKQIPIRRVIEITVFAVLIGTACYWLYRQLADISARSSKPVVQGSAESTPEENTSAATASSQAAPQPTGPAPTATTEDVPDGESWRGWSIKSEAGGKSTYKRDWEISPAGVETYIETLILADGTVRLSQRRQLAANERWLEIRARPELQSNPGNKAQRVIIRVNGADVDELKIGSGTVRWPAFVSLEKFAGQQVDLEVVYEAGEKGQQISWRNLDFVAQKREIAKRINCGGPAIESADGDWEPDTKKVHPYLVSPGTWPFTIKESAPGTGELQKVNEDERWANQFVEYAVPVEPGNYEVILHFAETNPRFQAAGKRQFDILLNGQKVAEKFDIFQKANGPGALVFRQRLEVKESPLQIRLQANPSGPAIKGIEILKLR